MPSNESIKDYNVYEQLGQGGFAQVYRAQVKESGKEVAIKMVSNPSPIPSGTSPTFFFIHYLLTPLFCYPD